MTETSQTPTGAADTRPDNEPEQRDEELRYNFPGDNRHNIGRSISTRTMLRRLPELIRRALALAWRADRRSTLLLLLAQAASGVFGALALYATTGTLTALLHPGPVTEHLRAAAPSLTLLTASAALRAALGIAVMTLAGKVGPRVNRDADLALIEAGCSAELAAYDQPSYNESWESADRGAATTPDLLTSAQDVIASTISLIAAAGVLASLNLWLVPFLLLGSIPAGIAAVRTARIHYLATITTNDERAALRIYRWHLIDKQRADQVRSDQILPFMMAKYRAAEARIVAVTDRAGTDAARVSLLAALATGAGAVLMWGALLYLVSTGRIGLAAAGSATFALRTAAGGVQGMVGNGARLYRMGLYLDDFFSFLDEAGGHRIARGSTVPGPPRTIEVTALTYAYPGEQQKPALRGIDLTLHQGEVVAVIGQNGSGKSTLLKLLSGLYLPQPDGGQITWDGVPIADLDADGLWTQVARVPQEFARWPLPAHENIHLGRHDGDRDRAVTDAAALTGFDEVVARLRSG
ncbi:ATP-binding cassette domain-containing protein [Kitasatospora griseola]|uniref:ATP-binding cassette domain-containing protein n=1 Tax=Kitasatospora griseola TaxID=2064 RepID=UPI00381506CA